MCSIVIGTSTYDVRDLVELNKSRGSHSYSLYYINQYTMDAIHMEKSLGKLDPNIIEIPEGHFAVIHQQAPTTQAKDISSVHPSTIDTTHLWHNGIIKAETCKQIREKLGVDDVWDTSLLHQVIVDHDRHVALDDIDGSFACAMYDEGQGLYIFRNEIAPFYTDNHSLSSTQFEGSKPLIPNFVYGVRFPSLAEGILSFTQVDEFKTKINPYYFGE